MTGGAPPPLDETDVAPDAYATVLAARPERLAQLIARQLASERVMHGAGEEEHVFHLDPVPRVIEGAEWAELEAGLAQRLRALEAFVADAHGERAVFAAGVVPDDLLAATPYWEESLAGIPAPPFRIGVYGPDVVRGGDGRLVVLEDNVRTPTLMAYALLARRQVGGRLADPSRPGLSPRPFAETLRAGLRRMLAAAAPGSGDPHVVILGDGRASAVSWEIDALGELLDVPVVGLEQLAARGRELRMRDGGRRVDVVWRRTSEERLEEDDGSPAPLGVALLEPLRAGTLRVVNAFGTGIADDKRAYPYVEDLIRFLLGEEPLLRSLPTYDLARPDVRAEALERLDELVLKPRSGSGGHGVVIGPSASAHELDAARAEVESRPEAWVAQEAIVLSTHPTVVDEDGGLAPRHLDLRPFVLADGERIEVVPGGLSRVALTEGDMVVNCSQGGGGKDTWVLGVPADA